MLIEKYFGIDRETVQQMIDDTKSMTHEKTGDNGFQNTKVFLFDDYAVLKMQNINVRNVETQDPDLKHLEKLALTLLDLQAQGIGVVPILAFESENGNGYIIQQRAKGTELYDKKRLSDKKYVLERVKFFSNVPQKHFDKFTADTIKIINAGVIVDSVGKDNFFYDEAIGFQFIDLNAHDDYEYGLTDRKPQGDQFAFLNCYLPLSHCPSYFVTMPKYGEVVSRLISVLTDEERVLLKEYNNIIFEKCKTAVLNNGITGEIITDTGSGFVSQMKLLGLI